MGSCLADVKTSGRISDAGIQLNGVHTHFLLSQIQHSLCSVAGNEGFELAGLVKPGAFTIIESPLLLTTVWFSCTYPDPDGGN